MIAIIIDATANISVLGNFISNSSDTDPPVIKDLPKSPLITLLT